MRVLITMFPWEPHYYPVVPLGWAFQLAGHEVRVASMPTMTDVVRRSGLPGASVGPDPLEAFTSAGVTFVPPKGSTTRGAADPEYQDWPDDWPVRPAGLGELISSYFAKIGFYSATMAEAHLADLIRYGRDWRADLIIHDPAQFAGPVAASALGIPNVRYLLGYPGLMRIDTCYGPDPVPEYVRLFRQFGCQPRIEPTAWIDPCPPSMQFALTSGSPVLPMRYVPYGAGAIPGWADQPDRPRVCLSWGHTQPGWDGRGILSFVRELVAAISRLDVQLVLAISPAMAEQLGELPAGIKVAVGAPMNALLASCAAVIHHGGPGTTMAASSAGVPQLMVTNHPHNSAIAARVAAIGAGAHLRLHEAAMSVERVRDTLVALLEQPSYHQAAGALRREIAGQPGPADIVAELDQLVTRCGDGRMAAV